MSTRALARYEITVVVPTREAERSSPEANRDATLAMNKAAVASAEVFRAVVTQAGFCFTATVDWRKTL